MAEEVGPISPGRVLVRVIHCPSIYLFYVLKDLHHLFGQQKGWAIYVEINDIVIKDKIKK